MNCSGRDLNALVLVFFLATTSPSLPSSPHISPYLEALVLVSMLATTFLAHYNAPKFYAELAAPKREI